MYESMAGAQEDDSEFSFTAAVIGFHVYHRVWLPHLGQRLSTEKEHGNAEDRFVIPVREHTDTRADEDVDDRPIVGHLPRELITLKQATCKTYLTIFFDRSDN